MGSRQSAPSLSSVITGLIPVISMLKGGPLTHRDGRDEPGHDTGVGVPTADRPWPVA
jgi:hypothetical protein